jgi:truncated hemoglobin YjbI
MSEREEKGHRWVRERRAERRVENEERERWNKKMRFKNT